MVATEGSDYVLAFEAIAKQPDTTTTRAVTVMVQKPVRVCEGATVENHRGYKPQCHTEMQSVPETRTVTDTVYHPPFRTVAYVRGRYGHGTSDPVFFPKE
jgi:hypothetical protein